ncbi:MAG TPA: HAD family hydrolase [Verrucomicrobiae bacterium]|nr:HAD family hydrolase [Verrucomicrobiae bacterium]
MSTTRTLLIDADDTLWENNIYFEQVITGFIAKLGTLSHPAERVEQLLWETEQRNVKVTGYGSMAFCQSLEEVVRALNAPELEPWIREKQQWIQRHPIELMPGVRETLPRLHAANRLILLTKGRAEEQLAKLARSSLAQYFHAVEVVFEKSVQTYQEIIAKHRLAPSQTWMIGNSPRSDINPAKAAGLGTVFIPYHTTWQHELEEITPDGATLMLENFGQLADHFV